MLAPEFTFFNESMNSCDAQVTPPTVSLLPLMYFVSEWITISAPSFAGDTDNGENVLSTTSFKLCFFAIFESPAISATSSKGLLTVSQYNTLVSLVIAASTKANFVMSTNEVVMPKRGVKFLRNA